MKIYFNRRPVAGPWGGGSKILRSIIEESIKKGHQVYFEEQIRSGESFDLMFCIDPRPNQFVTFHDLLLHKQQRKTKLVQRIGDLGTHGKPELLPILKATSKFADLIVFPSKWAAEQFALDTSTTYKVIPNAPLQDFFLERNQKPFEKTLKIVSHHWSNNSMKGFEIYKALDQYCLINSKCTFTFIGRTPEGVALSNHIPPQDIDGLVKELPKHDVYVTASKFEAGANHVLEAMALGLPILYHKDGGSINEYCKNNGFEYDSVEMLIWLLENKTRELETISHRETARRTSTDMAREYVDLFEELYEDQHKH